MRNSESTPVFEALELHLSRCPPCITFVRTYKKTRSLCRIALAREMPAELVSSLKDFLARKGVPGFSGCAKGADGKSACGDAPAVEVKKA